MDFPSMETENSYGDAFVNRNGLLTDMQFIMLMGTKTGLP